MSDSSPPSTLGSEARETHRADEGFGRADRLRRRGDFERCYRTGRRRSGGLLFLVFTPNAVGQPRLGITASRKVGGSVVRQRLKRRVREVFRRWPERQSLQAIDLVVHLQPAAGKSTFPVFAAELTRLLGALPRLPALAS